MLCFHDPLLCAVAKARGVGQVARRANILVQLQTCRKSPIVWRGAWSTAAARAARQLEPARTSQLVANIAKERQVDYYLRRGVEQPGSSSGS